MYKKNAEEQLLDNKNPLGLPLKAPPLELLIQLNDLFSVELYCRYGNVYLLLKRSTFEPLKFSSKNERKKSKK